MSTLMWAISISMMTSSNGNIFCVTGQLCGEFTGPQWIPPAQRPVTRSFDVFFDLRLNKRLSKQTWAWWFEMLSRPLWHHCNGIGRCIDNVYLTHWGLVAHKCISEPGHHWFGQWMDYHPIWHKSSTEHIEAETKWPTFSGWHFQMHFLEWKCINFA